MTFGNPIGFIYVVAESDDGVNPKLESIRFNKFYLTSPEAYRALRQTRLDKVPGDWDVYPLSVSVA